MIQVIFGIYFITYTVTDSSGNKKQIQRKVIVENTIGIPDGDIDNTDTTDNTDTIDGTDDVDSSPMSNVPVPVITSIIRSPDSARVTAIDEESEIIGFAITESAVEPDTLTPVTPTTLLLKSITGLVMETDYYVWVKNAEGGMTCQVFRTLGMPIPIYTKEDLAKIGSNETILVSPDSEYQFRANSEYRLENDIDLSGISWTPLPAFSGTFDGNNKTISNLTINRTASYGGLFNTNTGRIKNLGLVNVDITNYSTGSQCYVGGIAGTSSGSGSQISNCYVTGTITDTRNMSGTATGIDYTGGIVGSLSGGSIIGCYNAANILEKESGSNATSR